MQKKNLLKGTFILTLSGILSKALGILFRIPVIYLIGEEGIGLYQLTYPLYTFLLALSSGIPTAISKMISERTVLNKGKEAQRIFKTASVILTLFGLISTTLLIVFADWIIKTLGWSSYAYYSILGISLAPLFTSILSAFKGYFQGLKYMSAIAASQIVEQIIRVAVGVGLTFFLLPYGIYKASFGASFGAAAGAAVGTLLLICYYSKIKIKYDNNQVSMSYIGIFKEIIAIAIPMSIAQTIGSIMALIDSAIVPGLLRRAGYSYQMSTILYGQLTGKAFVLISVPLTFSVALSQNTVPAVSEAYAVRDMLKLNERIRTAYKMAFALFLPACGGLFVLAKPILSLIFRDAGEGYELLKILSAAAIFISLGQTSTSILNGIGRAASPIYALVIGAVCKIIISYLFIPIPEFGIKAAAYGTLTSYFTIALIDFILVKKYTHTTLNIYKIIILPTICTAVMILGVVVIYGKVYNLLSINGVAAIVAIICGIIIYGAMLILTGTYTIREIKSTMHI